jgi:hypothetical protein
VAAVPAPAAAPSVTDEIARIQAGQAASKSLSGVGGAPSELSVEALAYMSEDEFAALYATKGKRIEAMLGRTKR